MVSPFAGAGLVQFYDAILAQHRRDSLDPELGRLLYDEIHTLTPGDSLNQVNLERRLGPGLNWADDMHGDRVFGDFAYRRVELPVIAVEYAQGVAVSEPQHSSEVARLVFFEPEVGAGAQRAVYEKTGQWHEALILIAADTTIVYQ